MMPVIPVTVDSLDMPLVMSITVDSQVMVLVTFIVLDVMSGCQMWSCGWKILI